MIETFRMDERYAKFVGSVQLGLSSHDAVCLLAVFLHYHYPSGLIPHGTLTRFAKEIHDINSSRSIKSTQNVISIAWKCARRYFGLLESYRKKLSDAPEAYLTASRIALSIQLKADLDKAGCKHHYHAIDEYLNLSE